MQELAGTDRHVGLVVLGLANVLPIRRGRTVEDEVRQRVYVQNACEWGVRGGERGAYSAL